MTPIQAVIRFDKKYLQLLKDVESLAKKYMAKGMAYDIAVARAFTEIAPAQTEKLIETAIINAIKDNVVSVSVAREVVKGWERSYKLDGADLSKRIYNNINNVNKVVGKEVQAALSKTQGWERTASQLQKNLPINGDIPKYLDKISKISGVDIGQANKRQLSRAISTARREIDRLSIGAAPTKRLKAAYESVINAINSGKENVVEKAVGRAIKEKAYYNAQRLARTETAKAYGDTFFDSILKDDDIVAYQSILSPRHPVPDICDFYATSDLYGLGKGVFPKHTGAPYPYHPNCLCIFKRI